MQLDIFNDSRDVMLRNDVLAALQRRDAPAARATRQTLADAFPGDEHLHPLQVLVDALEQPPSSPFADHDALRNACRALHEETLPAAQRLLGAAAGADWLAPLWRQLAQRAARLPFRADRADEHAAPLWLKAGDWCAAVDAVSGIESWHRVPAPLSWMAEARFRIDGLDAVWPLLAELAWLAPARWDDLTKRLGEPSLERLRKHFDASFEGRGSADDLAWFPAWVLTQKSGLARLLAAAQPSRDSGPERAMRVLVELIGLERQGRQHELIERRKALRDLHRSLYDAYMAPR